MAEAPDGRREEHDLIEAPDRRRPGRVAYANPHLIALLRRSSRKPPHADGLRDNKTEYDADERNDVDDLRPAIGIAVSVVIGVLLWLALIWLYRKI